MATNNLWLGGAADHTTEWDQAANWSDGVPVDADHVLLPKGADYDLDDAFPTGSAIPQLDTFTVEPGHTQTVGAIASLCPVDLDTAVSGGDGVARLAGTGSYYLDFYNAEEVHVQRARASGTALRFGTNLFGQDNGLLVVRCRPGEAVGLGMVLGVAAEFEEILVEGGALYIGEDVVADSTPTPVKTLTVRGGVVHNWANLTQTAAGQVVIEGGEFHHHKGIVLQTLELRGAAVCRYNASGAGGKLDGTLELYDEARIDFSGAAGAVTVDACKKIGPGARILDPGGRVTWTTAIEYPGGTRAIDVFGYGRKLTVADI